MLKNFAVLLYQNNLSFPYDAVIFATVNSESLVAGYTRGFLTGDRRKQGCTLFHISLQSLGWVFDADLLNL